ncbi:MAG: hypothetical protein AAB336_12565 [Acidobacteriota bacterium]
MTDNPWIQLFLTTENFIQSEFLPEPDAAHFLQKAKKAIDSAKNEITFGETINELLLSNEGGLKDCHKSLATIGIWHFECAVELFNKAIRNFEKAKKLRLSKVSMKEIDAQIKDSKKQLAEATKQKDLADDLLNSINK